MEIILHEQAETIEYFDLFDFISKIKLEPYVLEHMQEVNLKFDDYFKKMSTYDDDFAIYFWISLAYEEMLHNHYVENHRFSTFDLSAGDLFFDRLTVSHNRIHDIHKFIMKDEEDKSKVGTYRKDEVRVSHIGNNVEEIFWYGAQPEDVKRFMDSFIQVYKSNNMSVIDSNPFLKSALIHLLFVKIHPYSDGNGRTARTLHNIKFTEVLNRLYDMNLKISPVNLSQSININLITYVKILDSIFFDIKHDNNEMLNRWFDYNLNMYEEQLNAKQIMIDDIDGVMERIMKVKERTSEETIKKIEKIRIR